MGDTQSLLIVPGRWTEYKYPKMWTNESVKSHQLDLSDRAVLYYYIRTVYFFHVDLHNNNNGNDMKREQQQQSIIVLLLLILSIAICWLPLVANGNYNFTLFGLLL